MLADPLQEFRNAMRGQGIDPPDRVIQDGNLHRFRVDGDRGRGQSGWYVYFPGDFPAGAFGNWRTGTSQRWRAGGLFVVSAAQLAAISTAIAEGREQRRREVEAAHAAARRRAESRWERASVDADGHPYLIRKGVRAHGLRLEGEALLVPMRDAAGALWGCQTISPAGEKRFMSGGRKRGLFHLIGGPVTGTLLIAEGYATAATLHAATGDPAACAFDAGNLLPVAEALRAAYPCARIVVCADDDAGTEARIGRNPGLEAAAKAARAVGGFVAVPPVRGAA